MLNENEIWHRRVLDRLQRIWVYVTKLVGELCYIINCILTILKYCTSKFSSESGILMEHEFSRKTTYLFTKNKLPFHEKQANITGKTNELFTKGVYGHS